MRPEDLDIPEDALSESFLAATGPGGQDYKTRLQELAARGDDVGTRLQQLPVKCESGFFGRQ